MTTGKSSFLPPDVTISIVSHGDSDKVSVLLESLRLCEPARRFQVLLTDNLGTDLPDHAGNEKTTINIILNQRPQGFSKNHNKALQQARAGLVCILNPDVVFLQPIFERLGNLLDTGKTNIAAPLMVDQNGTVQDSFRPIPRPLDIVKRRLPGYKFSPSSADADGCIWPDWIAGACMIMKRETYRRLHGFDERYHLYFEDVDFCTRARLLGLKILVDTGVRIRHDSPHNSRRSLTYLLWHLQSAIRFYRSPTYKAAIRIA